MITVEEYQPEFKDWDMLLDLIQQAYAYMDARIDPPSSMHRLTVESLIKKAAEETLLLAWENDHLRGCAFLREQEDSYYVGKLAVKRNDQGKGIGQKIIEACIQAAARNGKGDLELETRVELIENHVFFEMMGFIKTGETSHEGYTRPTAFKMRRAAGEKS